VARLDTKAEIDDIERSLADLSARLAALEQSVERDLDAAGIPSGAPVFEIRARVQRMRDWLSALEKTGHATAMLTRARCVVRAWLAERRV
jgi:hypothetical protein